MGTADVRDIPFIQCYIEDSVRLTGCLTEDYILSDTASDYVGRIDPASIFPRKFSVLISEEKIPFYEKLCKFVNDLSARAKMAVPAPDDSDISDNSDISGVSDLTNLCTDYFKLLVELLIVTERALGTSAFEPNKRLLEEFYFIGCIRDVYRGRYILPPYYPVLSLHDLAADDGRLQVDKLKNNHYKHGIAEAIVSNKARRDREFLMFSSDEIYQVSKLEGENNTWVADLFQNAKTLVKVESIRLIEKVERYIREHDISEKASPVRIAAFGEMADGMDSSPILKKYIEKMHQVKVEITGFKRMPLLGDYVFVPENAEGSFPGKNIFNLMDNADIEALYGNYSLILFLGENYFYRQHQGEKMAREIRVSSRANWYVNVMAEAYSEFKDKAICYNRCFDGVGSWINTYDDALSGALQFDEKLFKKLGSVEHPDADVYLYIKYGKSIGECDLYTQNICNDELYDGHSLMVYCYSKHSDDINDALMNFLGNKLTPQYRVYINLWKLVKSLGNGYWITFAEDVGLLNSDPGDEDKYNDDLVNCIYQLRQIQFYIDYSQLAKSPDQKVINYGVVGVGEQIKDKISSYVKAILQFAFAEKEKKIREKIKANFQKEKEDAIDLPCVHKYLRDLLVNSIISRANHTQDLLFAYLLYMEKYDIKEVTEISDETKSDRRPYNNVRDFRAPKLIYSIIVKLEQLNLRSLDDPEFYFTEELRHKISPHVSKENMVQIMKRTGDACNDLKYVSNLLYYCQTI